jgi:hypothetical protein
MSNRTWGSVKTDLVAFDRAKIGGPGSLSRMGTGSIGGKAHGLASVKSILETAVQPHFESRIAVGVPTLVVIAADYFDLFLKDNNLAEIALAKERDDVIAHAFQRAELPAQLVGDLRALVAEVRTPLAVRSSSMLEDAMFEPFASVYATKMIPNNQTGTDTRFRKLAEAVKYVYASTFFHNAKDYIKATHHSTEDERMAVIIQELVGCDYGERFYPEISGVARSYNFYPIGYARPEDGVVDLALGLGKTIVDDGMAWSYSPACPQANPPYNSLGELLEQTQTRFWAINMRGPEAYDPIKESEYIQRYDLSDAEQDRSLGFIASTYREHEDRVVMGVGERGPRVLDFGPILKADEIPLNEMLKTLLKSCEDALGCMVEMEFAVTLGRARSQGARFGFLQVRPMVVSDVLVELPLDELYSDRALVASESVLGNGVASNITDVVYVLPDSFRRAHTQTIADQLERLNRELLDAGTRYLLMGFGRWGTTDPQGGIPVNFGQISGAKVIVEATLPGMNFILSQGSHFFHNITSFKIGYFSVPYDGRFKIDWDWLNSQTLVADTGLIRHARLARPLTVKIDGRTGRGVILHE